MESVEPIKCESELASGTPCVTLEGAEDRAQSGSTGAQAACPPAHLLTAPLPSAPKPSPAISRSGSPLGPLNVQP